MIDANQTYLAQHEAAVVRADEAQDLIDAHVKELTSEGGEYYPWASNNIMEAIQNMNDFDEMEFTALARGCKKLPGNKFMSMMFSTHCISIVEKYGERLEVMAIKEASK